MDRSKWIITVSLVWTGVIVVLAKSPQWVSNVREFISGATSSLPSGSGASSGGSNTNERTQ